MLLLFTAVLALDYKLTSTHSTITFEFSAPLNAVPSMQVFYYHDTKIVPLPFTLALSSNQLFVTFSNSDTFRISVQYLFNFPKAVYSASNPADKLHSGLYHGSIQIPDKSLGLGIVNYVFGLIQGLLLLVSAVLYFLSSTSVSFYLLLDLVQTHAIYVKSYLADYYDAANYFFYSQPVVLSFPYFDVLGQGGWVKEVQVVVIMFVVGLVLLGLGSLTKFIQNNPELRFLRFNLPLFLIILCCPGLCVPSFNEILMNWEVKVTTKFIVTKVLSFVVVGFYAGFLVFCFFILWSKALALDTNLTRQTYGFLYKGLKTKSFFARNFWNIKLSKRFVLALVVSSSYSQIEYFKFVANCLFESFLILIIVNSSPLADQRANTYLLVMTILYTVTKCLLMVFSLESTITTEYTPALLPYFISYLNTVIIALDACTCAAFILYELRQCWTEPPLPEQSDDLVINWKDNRLQDLSAPDQQLLDSPHSPLSPKLVKAE